MNQKQIVQHIGRLGQINVVKGICWLRSSITTNAIIHIRAAIWQLQYSVVVVVALQSWVNFHRTLSRERDKDNIQRTKGQRGSPR